MTGEADAQTGGIFAKFHCKSLSYWCQPRAGEFHVADFLNAVGPEAVKVPAGSVTCSPSRPSSGYHLHISWRNPPAGEFSFSVAFYAKGKKKDPDEREPFAENFFQWMSQFFETQGPRPAHAHADFEYSSANRAVRFFPLPIKTAIGEKVEIEIDGISFNLIEPIEGIDKLWLTQRPETLTVHLAADRQIDFQAFDIEEELPILSGAIDKILGEEKSNDSITNTIR